MNDDELAEAARIVNYEGPRTTSKVLVGKLAMMVGGAAVFCAGAWLLQGLALLTLSALGWLVFIRTTFGEEVAPVSRLELSSEGIADVDAVPRALLHYADIDAVIREDYVVVVRAGKRTLRVRAGNQLDTLKRYLDAQVARARALDAARAVATTFLARVDAAGGYRDASPPTSVLEAIARAKGMPVALRVEAARAAGLDEADVEITEDLKRAISIRPK